MIVLRRKGERFTEDSFEGASWRRARQRCMFGPVDDRSKRNGHPGGNRPFSPTSTPHHPIRYQFQKSSAITSGFASGVFGIGGLQEGLFCAGFLDFQPSEWPLPGSTHSGALDATTTLP